MSITIKLSETQSLVQLAIALNLAFGAYDTIRASIGDNIAKTAAIGASRAKDLLTRIESLDTEKYQKTIGSKSVDCAKVKAVEYNISLFKNVQNIFGHKYPYLMAKIFSIAALLGLSVLILTPVYADTEVTIPVYLLALAVLFGPVFFHLYINNLVSKSLLADMAKLKEEVGILDDISAKIDII